MNLMTSVLIKDRRPRRGEGEGKRSCEDRGRDWSDAASSQGMPRTTRNGEAGEHSPLEPTEGA